MKEEFLRKVKNKKSWIAFLVALILSYIVHFVYPVWHLIIFIGLIAGLIAANPKSGFLSSFGGVFIGWLLLLSSQSLNHPIAGSASLLANIMGLGESLWPLIVFLTLLIGGIIAGLSGLIGVYLRSIIEEMQ